MPERSFLETIYAYRRITMQFAHDIHSVEGHAVDAGFDSLDYSYGENPADQHGTILGERKLWCAVIEQAFVDIGAISPARQSGFSTGPVRAKTDREEAARWLLRDNPDFVRACLLAGVSPEVVRRAARQFFSTLDTE